MDKIKEYKRFYENSETLISIYFINHKKEEILIILNKELSKVSLIQNISKKTKLNDRLYKLKCKIEKLGDNSVINSLFLINNDLFEYKFTSNDINTIKEYKLREYYLKTDNQFDIDYLIDIFTNFDFYYSCQIGKNNIKLKKINKNKNKLIIENKFTSEKILIELVNNYILEHKINELLIYGAFNNIKCFHELKNNKLLLKEGELDNKNINDIFFNRKYEKNNILLEKKLNELKNPNTNLDLFIFGKLKKEILEAIECYQLKELYIEERKLDKLRNFVDDSYLNFTIIPIQSLENGDIANTFIKDYNGLMGIKYY